MSARVVATCAGIALGFGLVTAATLAAPKTSSSVTDAVLEGDVSGLLALLESGADQNEASGDGMTGLHLAARAGHVEIAKILISAGADVEATTRIGAHTPLHVASSKGRAALVRALTDAGANVDALTETGAAPLHFAAQAGNAEAVAALLEAGANPNVREPLWGQTPLMFAAASGRTEAVEALLEHGADATIAAKVVDVTERSKADRAERRDRNRRVAEMRATEAGILPAEVDPKKAEEERRAAEARAREREEAERRGNEPEPLNYADLVGKHGGLTPLLLAAREGHTETALALIQGGVDVNETSAADGTSPMLMATINGYFDLAMKLFELGADPELTSDAGATPLYAALNMHWAPKARHPQPVAYMQQETTYLEMMETLLEAGVDPNVRLKKTLWYTTYNRDLLGVDRTGATPFWRAAYALDIPAMKLLLKHGADPSLPTIRVPERRDQSIPDGEIPEDHSGVPPVPYGGPAVYPIHAASGVGYGQGFAGNTHRHVPDGWLPAVRFLVEELGADVTQRDHHGYTPIHHAAARGDNELIHYLVSKGADAAAVARNGQTTADMANGPVQRIQPFPDTVELLMSLGSKNNNNCVSC